MRVDVVADDGVWLVDRDVTARVSRPEWSASGDMLDWWTVEPGTPVDVEVLSIDEDAGFCEASRRLVVGDHWGSVVDAYGRGAPIQGWVFASRGDEVAAVLAEDVIGVSSGAGPAGTWVWFQIQHADPDARTIRLVEAPPIDESSPPSVRFWGGVSAADALSSAWGREPGDPWTAQWWDSHGFDPDSARPWRTRFWQPPEAAAYVALGVDQELAARYRAAEFRIGDGPSWARSIDDPLTAIAFRDAGFDAAEAGRWAAAGLDPADACAWRDDGFTAEDARHWLDNGFPLTDAGPWRTAGLSAPDAAAWHTAGFDAIDAAGWVRYGFGVDEAVLWRDAGAEPDEAHAWSAAGCPPADWKAWQRVGDPERASPWLAAHIRPDIALDYASGGWDVARSLPWITSGRTFRSAAAWDEAGATPDEADQGMRHEIDAQAWRRWRDAGADGGHIPAWRDLGLQPEQASLWIAEGFWPGTARSWIQIGVAADEAGRWTALGVGPLEVSASGGVWSPDRYQAWHAAGFSLPEAAEWAALGDVEWSRRWREAHINAAVAATYVDAHWSGDDAIPWAAAGLDVASARGWHEGGFALQAALAWSDADVSPGDARCWSQHGVSPSEVSGWRKTGLGLDGALAWVDAELSAEEASRWVATGLAPDEASTWVRHRFDPAEAQRWDKAQFTATQGGAWRKAGFGPTEAARWRKAGFGARPAGAWAGAGHPPSRATRWAKAGWEPLPAGEWIDAGFDDPAEAAKWNHHVGPTVARSWVDAGWRDPVEANRWRRAGWSAAVAYEALERELRPSDGRPPRRLDPPPLWDGPTGGGRRADRLFGSPRTDDALARWAGDPPDRPTLNRRLGLGDAALQAAGWTVPRRMRPVDAALLPVVTGLRCGSEPWERTVVDHAVEAVPFVFKPQIAELFMDSEPIPDDVRGALRLPYERTVVVLGAPFRFEDDHLALLADRRRFDATYEPWLDRLTDAGGSLLGFVLTSRGNEVLADRVVWLVAVDGTLVPIPGSLRGSALRPSAELVLAGLLYSKWFRTASARDLAALDDPGASSAPEKLHVIDMRSVQQDLKKAASGSKRSAHLRRGHFRRQPYGPRSDPWYETIWIRPMVIGGTLGADDRRRVYRVPAFA